jgi:hypothetical protein
MSTPAEEGIRAASEETYAMEQSTSIARDDIRCFWSKSLLQWVTIPGRLTCDRCGADESEFVDDPKYADRVICGCCGAEIGAE